MQYNTLCNPFNAGLICIFCFESFIMRKMKKFCETELCGGSELLFTITAALILRKHHTLIFFTIHSSLLPRPVWLLQMSLQSCLSTVCEFEKIGTIFVSVWSIGIHVNKAGIGPTNRCFRKELLVRSPIEGWLDLFNRFLWKNCRDWNEHDSTIGLTYRIFCSARCPVIHVF